MENLWKKYGGSVKFVALNMKETLADLQTWLAGLPGGITFPVLHNTDWSIAGLYCSGVMYWPFVVVIDSEGIIQRVLSAGTLFTEAELEGHILDVLYTRDPVDIELVVDVSDTMNSPAPSMPLGDSKLVLLKQAANIVMDVIVAHGQANDNMGLVRFTDDATEYVHNNDKLLSLAQNEVRLRGEIDTLTTGTCTAMGAGLQRAFDTLAAEGTQHRFAILCTDGMQNIEPKITEVGGHCEIIDSGGWLCGSHSSVPPHPGVDIRTYDARVHTIGIGATSQWEPLLQTIADQTGGFHRSTSDPQTDLALIYAVDLCSCLALGSPTLVRHGAGTLHPEECQVIEEFQINRTTRKVTVALFWQAGDQCSLTFWLRAPDGTLVPLAGALHTLTDRCVATLFLPLELGGRQVNHVGRWTVAIRGEIAKPGPIGYQLLVVAEDHESKCNVDYPRRPYAVGDIVPIGVRLPAVGKLPHRIIDVVLETIRPRLPLAEVLQRYPMSQLQLEQTAAATSRGRLDPRALLQAKLRRIEADPRVRDLLRPERSKTSLRAATLECTVGERELTIPVRLTQPGVSSYRLELLCESRESGPVARVNYLSVFAGAGPLSPNRSTVGVVKREGKERSGVVLTLTPKNDQGQLLGPGLGAEIMVVSGHERHEAVVTDFIDGTYEIEVVHKAHDADRKVSVLIAGKTVWAGAV